MYEQPIMMVLPSSSKDVNASPKDICLRSISLLTA